MDLNIIPLKGAAISTKKAIGENDVIYMKVRMVGCGGDSMDFARFGVYKGVGKGKPLGLETGGTWEKKGKSGLNFLRPIIIKWNNINLARPNSRPARFSF